MMVLARRLLGVSVLAVFAAPGLRAQTEVRHWTACPTGVQNFTVPVPGQRACSGIFLTTTPVFDLFNPALRVGTTVALALQNQEGTNPFDNSGGSLLRYVTFAGPPDGGQTLCGGFLCAPNPAVVGAPSGPGASGSGLWEFETADLVPDDGSPGSGYFGSIFTAPIGGCSDASQIVTGNDRSVFTGVEERFRTCGPNAWVSFVVTVPVWVDANLFDYGLVSTTGQGNVEYECNLFGHDGCVVAATTSPEPSTVLLAGIGLFALAVFGPRRRRRASRGAR